MPIFVFFQTQRLMTWQFLPSSITDKNEIVVGKVAFFDLVPGLSTIFLIESRTFLGF